MVEKMKTIGVVAGQPFDLAKLDPASVQAVEEGAKPAIEGIVAAAKKGSGQLKSGWNFSLDWGRYGTRYAERAAIPWVGLGANAAEGRARGETPTCGSPGHDGQSWGFIS